MRVDYTGVLYIGIASYRIDLGDSTLLFIAWRVACSEGALVAV